MLTAARIRNFLLIALLAGWATDAAAIRDIPEKKGWGGNFMFGGGYVDAETNLLSGIFDFQVGNDTVGSINQAPESKDTALPAVPFEIRWTFNDNQWQAFYGLSLEEFVALDIATQLGVRKQAGKAGIFQLGYLFNAAPSQVWEDSYLTGTPRRETDRNNTGVRFQWDKIGGSGFEIQLTFRDVDLDLDLNGVLQTDVALTQAELDSLRRDGEQMVFRGRYVWKLGDKNRLRFEVGFRENDRDGAAVSSDTQWGEILYGHRGKKWLFAGTVTAGSREYDEANPIYGVKTDGDFYSASVTVFRKLQTESKRWALMGMAAHAEEDNDVQFHETALTMFMVGAQYVF